HKTDDEIHAYFEALGIGDKETQLCGKLSFGQQQRVAMIRSLCQPFDFVFLDEPISHLDEVNSGIMGRLVVEEAKRQGAAIIVTSIGKHIDLPYDHIFKL
ncbi:MAG: ATP-binding cassette domain-containing protein, partial [Bacteroidaceae bacterium]|nr:ATP-binding cassette domain-containing protein [Bacteroidaceae bacterium]